MSGRAKRLRAQPKPFTKPSHAPDLAIRFALAASILIVYAQVGHFDFNTYDDRPVDENPHFRAGLMADSIGLSIILAWGAADVIKKWPHWRNSETLFQRAIDVTHDKWVAQYNLGRHLMSLPGRQSDPIAHFEAALRIKTDYAEGNNNLGSTPMNTSHNAEAVPHPEAAVREKPNDADMRFNLGWRSRVFRDTMPNLTMPGRQADSLAQVPQWRI